MVTCTASKACFPNQQLTWPRTRPGEPSSKPGLSKHLLQLEARHVEHAAGECVNTNTCSFRYA
jgi:hypothetical protein